MLRRRTIAWTTFVGLFAISSGEFGCLSGPDPVASQIVVPVPPRGCVVQGSTPPPVAPNGYYTSGGAVCEADGTPHVFHGVDRPSLEWSSGGENISLEDFSLMAGWGANVVRLALNQDFWLPGAALYDPSYASTVQTAVKLAERAGLDVILDLHWSDCGDFSVSSTQKQGCGYSNQQSMADTNSLEFWRQVATLFKDDGRVLFELYNEPHGIPWDVWLNGGMTGTYTAVGMQALYESVRATGANNVVIAGGIAWAYDLSDVHPGGHFINGYNVMYATHPYSGSGDARSSWEPSFGHVETADFAPVIATEFGDNRMQCTGDWDQQVITFVDDHKASWTAWAWYPKDCTFPSLIDDWSGTPSVQGAVVKSMLGSYPKSQHPPVVGDEAGAALDDAAGDAVASPARDPDASFDATVDTGTDEAAASAAGDGSVEDATWTADIYVQEASADDALDAGSPDALDGGTE